jgi:hypothetical protein
MFLHNFVKLSVSFFLIVKKFEINEAENYAKIERAGSRLISAWFLSLHFYSMQKKNESSFATDHTSIEALFLAGKKLANFCLERLLTKRSCFKSALCNDV